ncbi:VWA domain-containing protein [Tunturiibacter lichenicola]|uniref:VWA domain-containing protein n=1 Tax=Tunturiibacter lichenicola TaxID=2051959 RepID=UPI0021B3A3C0|nr:VWA domain-containing protein [Edaphobacter lichenicola]
MHLRSRIFGPWTAAAGLIMLVGGASGWAQQPAASQAQAKQQPGAGQPSLTVDRDPVASPDPDLPAASQTGTAKGVAAGTIARENGKYTLRQDAYEVRLNATVLDGSGRSVQTLGKDDFHVYEDGVPQTIASFRHEDLPVSLGLLIDSSGSMYDKRQAVDKASVDFVKLSNPEDEEFLVDFSWEAFIDQDFTNSIDKLQQGLGFIKSSGGTAIYDALVASADYLAKNAKHPKQVLLVVTDGEDNASSATLEQTIRRIQDLDGPVIYCVGLLFGDDTDKRESRHARRVLETLAEQTGGAAYFPKSVHDVDAIAAEVAQDIRTQYTIAYHSTKSPTLGGYREVHVEAKSKNFGRLSVRTRTGYYPRVVADASKGGDAEFSSGKKNQ